MSNQQKITYQLLESKHADALLQYLHLLSPSTRKRFGPHPFDVEAIWAFYQPHQHNLGFIAVEETTAQIIAYFIIKKGLLDHDIPRLRQYGLILNSTTDFTLAPSVADAWQNSGIGTPMLQFVLREITKLGAERLVLWGGVQSDNAQAVRFYQKNGFSTLGHFEYNGPNTDMMLTISHP